MPVGMCGCTVWRPIVDIEGLAKREKTPPTSAGDVLRWQGDAIESANYERAL